MEFIADNPKGCDNDSHFLNRTDEGHEIHSFNGKFVGQAHDCECLRCGNKFYDRTWGPHYPSPLKNEGLQEAFVDVPEGIIVEDWLHGSDLEVLK